MFFIAVVARHDKVLQQEGGKKKTEGIFETCTGASSYVIYVTLSPNMAAICDSLVVQLSLALNRLGCKTKKCSLTCKQEVHIDTLWRWTDIQRKNRYLSWWMSLFAQHELHQYTITMRKHEYMYIIFLYYCLIFNQISEFQQNFWILSELKTSIWSHFWNIYKLIRSAVKICGCWFSAAGSCASLSSDWSIPAHNTHTTHTHLWVSISLNFVFSLSLIWSYFSLSHLISIPPSLSVRTGKKQGPPENRNKGNPSIHPSVPLCPSILPVSHSILTLHPAAGGECPVHLSLLYKGGRSLALLYLWKGATLNLQVFDSQSQRPQLS